jgi:hypothetical protein
VPPMPSNIKSFQCIKIRFVCFFQQKVKILLFYPAIMTNRSSTFCKNLAAIPCSLMSISSSMAKLVANSMICLK